MRTCLSSNQQIWQILRKSELLFWVTLIFYSNKISDKALKERPIYRKLYNTDEIKDDTVDGEIYHVHGLEESI